MLRQARGRSVKVLLALSVGVLIYLAVDTTFEVLSWPGGAVLGGGLLIILGAAFAYLVLMGVDRRMRSPHLGPLAGTTRRAGCGWRC